ncbi:MAG: hypothetical protein HQL52_09390 [Magnetococcales bacterium]|nr:hypothetical protein [Magnetococcales bacterium]
MKQRGIKINGFKLLSLAGALGLGMGLMACGGGGGSSSSSTTTKSAQDDYIVNASVWCDVDSDGVKDTDETNATTTSTTVGTLGQFSLPSDCTTGQLVLKGFDKSTTANPTNYSRNVNSDGEEISRFTGILFAPNDYEYLTPISSMVALLGGDAAAETAVLAALNITLGSSTELGSLNMNDTSSEDAINVRRGALVVQQIVLDATSALQGARNKPITPNSMALVGDQLADLLSALSTAGTPLISSSLSLDETIFESTFKKLLKNTANNNTTKYGDISPSLLNKLTKSAAKQNVKNILKAQALISSAYSSGGDMNAAVDAAAAKTSNVQSGATTAILTFTNLLSDQLQSDIDSTDDLITLLNEAATALLTSVKNLSVTTETTGDSQGLVDVDALQDSIQLMIEQQFLQNTNLEGNSYINGLNTAYENVIKNANNTNGIGGDDNVAPEAFDFHFFVDTTDGTETEFFLDAWDPNEEEGDTITFTVTSTLPSSVTAVNDDGSDGLYKYTGTGAEIDADSPVTITFMVTDSAGLTSGSATASLFTGSGGNEAPWAFDDYWFLEMPESGDGELMGTLWAWDPESDDVGLVNWTVSSQPSAGTVTVDTNGDFTLSMPEGTSSGMYTFSFTVDDADGNTSEAASIEVEVFSSGNDAPDSDFDEIWFFTESSEAEAGFVGFVPVEDPDGDTLTYTVGGLTTGISTTEGGTVDFSTDLPDEFTYYAPTDFFGEDSFTVTVSDGTESIEVTVYIIVDYDGTSYTDYLQITDDTVNMAIGTGAEVEYTLEEFQEGLSFSADEVEDAIAGVGSMSINVNVVGAPLGTDGTAVVDLAFRATDNDGRGGEAKGILEGVELSIDDDGNLSVNFPEGAMIYTYGRSREGLSLTVPFTNEAENSPVEAGDNSFSVNFSTLLDLADKAAEAEFGVDLEDYTIYQLAEPQKAGSYDVELIISNNVMVVSGASGQEMLGDGYGMNTITIGDKAVTGYGVWGMIEITE